ncbi:MAG: ATP-binding cassette domain-containing protein [Paracoccaceae bacterium]
MAQAPVLTLSDIMLTFGGNPLFAGLNLSITQGERICLVGRNGAGKSTLLKVMAGLVEPDGGDVHLRPGNAIAYMEQDPDLSGFATLGEYAASGLDVSENYRVERVMEGVKLNIDQAPDQASGGERRRAALAKLLASDADLLLLDEPTNHLDIEVIAWLEDHLKQTRRAYVLISHDRAFLRNLTRTTLWVDRGIVRRANKGFEHFEDWRDTTFAEEDLNRHKLDRLIKSEARWAVEGISGRRKRNIGRVGRLAEMKEGRADQIRRVGAAKMQFDGAPKSGRLVVEATGISKTYNNNPIVQDFSLRVMRGERIAFVGPNGVGKTTLLKMLLGEISPDSGTIKLGTNLLPAVFDQNRSALNPDATLWESLTEDKELGVSGKNDQIMVRGRPKHVVAYLKEFLFTDKQARSKIRALSGGEKARLLLSKLMARENNILILDEPTNDLDVETLDLLQELIDDYDGTVLLVSHDRDFLDRIASTTIAMEGDGQATVYAGGYSDYMAQRGVREIEAPQQIKKRAKEPGGSPDKSPKTMTFKQEHRLKELPDIIARFEAEIAKLEVFMSDPALFTEHPVKFQKATDALVERHTMLAEAEEEWMALEELR